MHETFFFGNPDNVLYIAAYSHARTSTL